MTLREGERRLGFMGDVQVMFIIFVYCYRMPRMMPMLPQDADVLERRLGWVLWHGNY